MGLPLGHDAGQQVWVETIPKEGTAPTQTDRLGCSEIFRETVPVPRQRWEELLKVVVVVEGRWAPVVEIEQA